MAALSVVSLHGVHDGIKKKVGSNQAHRIVLNLSETEVTPADLRQYLQNNPIAKLKEIILIDQSGKITNFFPFKE